MSARTKNIRASAAGDILVVCGMARCALALVFEQFMSARLVTDASAGQTGLFALVPTHAWIEYSRVWSGLVIHASIYFQPPVAVYPADGRSLVSAPLFRIASVGLSAHLCFRLHPCSQQDARTV